MHDFSQRDPISGVSDLLWQRWSPRAFEGSPISDDVVARLIDAARWAPSCRNEQPWRFHTSTSTTFNDFLALLVEGNQGWAKSASLLGFIICERHFQRNGDVNHHARFDAGAAWMALTLQAQAEGLYTHGLGGIKYDEVAQYLAIDTERYDVVMGFAVGRAIDVSALSEEQRSREIPNGRMALADIWQSHG